MPRATELLLHETFGDDGRTSLTTLRDEDGALVLSHAGDETEIDASLVFGVFARYAKEIDPGVEVVGDALALGADARLVRLRHLARFDVIARDWLVLERKGEPARAELATAITAALVHLVDAARARA